MNLFDFHFDLLWLRILVLRQGDRQQSVLELRKDLVRVDVGWQCEAAQEFAIDAFDAMKVLTFYFLGKLSLASDRQHIALDADKNVFLSQTGELGSNDDFLQRVAKMLISLHASAVFPLHAASRFPAAPEHNPDSKRHFWMANKSFTLSFENPR